MKRGAQRSSFYTIGFLFSLFINLIYADVILNQQSTGGRPIIVRESVQEIRSPRTISVFSNAKAYAEPDSFIYNFQIRTEAKTVKATLEHQKAINTKIKAIFKNFRLKSQFYNFSPPVINKITELNQNKRPVIKGYWSYVYFEIHSEPKMDFSNLMDKLLLLPDLKLQKIMARSSQYAKVSKEVLSDAISKSYQKAYILSKSSKTSIGSILEITEIDEKKKDRVEVEVFNNEPANKESLLIPVEVKLKVVYRIKN